MGGKHKGDVQSSLVPTNSCRGCAETASLKAWALGRLSSYSRRSPVDGQCYGRMPPTPNYLCPQVIKKRKTLRASEEGTLQGKIGEGPGDQTSWKKTDHKHSMMRK